jgi:hypothetical protein
VTDARKYDDRSSTSVKDAPFIARYFKLLKEKSFSRN